MKLKEIFENARIVALAGDKNTGKTNNLISLIVDYRKKKPNTPIYVYGMPSAVIKYLNRYNVQEISSLSHMVHKKDCLLVLDEFQKLKLNDRRYKDELNEFVDFVYHDNVFAILSSPGIREFNTVIGSIFDKWLLKSVRKDKCVNGSQLKKVIEDYKGKYKSLGSISVPKNELLLINDEEETIIKCKYIKEADTKTDNIDLFNCQEIVK